jgi:dTDP-4-dehydrorhamnose 3,5-epimerase
MKFTTAPLQGVVVIDPAAHEDERGFFFESYNRPLFAANGIGIDFVQDNHSRSAKGVLRGLHYQVAPRAQAKLVRATAGEVFDVVVDLREGSPTRGENFTLVLSAANRRMIFVPVGFAHGFLALTDGAEVQYMVSELYSKEHERGFLWSDPKLDISWPKLPDGYSLSLKDKEHTLFS